MAATHRKCGVLATGGENCSDGHRRRVGGSGSRRGRGDGAIGGFSKSERGGWRRRWAREQRHRIAREGKGDARAHHSRQHHACIHLGATVDGKRETVVVHVDDHLDRRATRAPLQVATLRAARLWQDVPMAYANFAWAARCVQPAIIGAKPPIMLGRGRSLCGRRVRISDAQAHAEAVVAPRVADHKHEAVLAGAHQRQPEHRTCTLRHVRGRRARLVVCAFVDKVDICWCPAPSRRHQTCGDTVDLLGSHRHHSGRSGARSTGSWR